MPNIANVLKSEIARVSRKEARSETEALKKASAEHRRQIAALGRRITELEREIRRLARGTAPRKAADEETAEDGPSRRFSAKGFAAQRKRLGLSAQALGALIGVSGQSVYHWESGKTRPRASQIEAIAAVRKMGKREAAARLAELSEAGTELPAEPESAAA